MKNHEQLFEALLARKKITNEFGNELMFDRHGMVVATTKGGTEHVIEDFTPWGWKINGSD